jgi:hypothetical protein
MCPILLNRRPEFSLTNCRNRWRPPELQEHSMGIVDFSGTTLLSLFFTFTIPPSYTSSITHKYTNTPPQDEVKMSMSLILLQIFTNDTTLTPFVKISAS